MNILCMTIWLLLFPIVYEVHAYIASKRCILADKKPEFNEWGTFESVAFLVIWVLPAIVTYHLK